MSLEHILSERSELLERLEKGKSEISSINTEITDIYNSQLSPIISEIEEKQKELERVKDSSGYFDLENKKKDLENKISEELDYSKMFVYRYLAQYLLNKKKFYNKWSKLFKSDSDSLKYHIDNVKEGKEGEFLRFIANLDNKTLCSLLWNTGYQYFDDGHDRPTWEVLKVGKKYPEFGENAEFYFSISNYFFSTDLPKKERDVYKRIDQFFK